MIQDDNKGFMRYMYVINRYKYRVVLLLMAAAVMVFPLSFAKAECQPKTIMIGNPVLTPTAPNAPVSAGYLVIHNHGKEAEKLIAVQTDFAKRSEIHMMKMEAGIMKMFALEEGIIIAPNQKLHFEKGGLHLMFIGLPDRLTPGEQKDIRLIFDHCGEINIKFTVMDKQQASHKDAKKHKHKH